MDDLSAFGRVVDALRPWLNHLVVVGGWAHRLYPFTDIAQPLPFRPLTTKDADIAFTRDAPLTGDMGEALRVAGFTEEFSGEHTPPGTEYRLGAEQHGFYAEFLTPLAGSSRTRDGREDATLRKAGVTAQKLRYLEILILSPWEIALDAENFDLRAAATVQIANPVAFVVQKLLINAARTPEKRAQDMLYLHDTLQLFSSSLEPLHSIWRDKLTPWLHKSMLSRIEQLAQEQYETVTDIHRDAALIPRDRSLTAESLRAACAAGLQMIFSGEP